MTHAAKLAPVVSQLDAVRRRIAVERYTIATTASFPTLTDPDRLDLRTASESIAETALQLSTIARDLAAYAEGGS